MLYDSAGNLTQTTDSRGKNVSYTYDVLNRKTGQYASTVAAQAPGASGNQTAAWTYDNDNAVSGVTNPIGKTTTATAYNAGNTYTTQQVGFNAFGESLGQSITIPAVHGALGGKTYTFRHTYTANTGLLDSDNYPLGGGLPSEIVGHVYATALDLPSRMVDTSYVYAQNTTYSAYGQVLQETLGQDTNLAYLTNTYDPHTGALTDQLVTRSTTPAKVDEQNYTYDPAGNTTKQVTTRLGTTAAPETQCYQYDELDRLTQAWTATDACSATPTTSSHTQVGDPLAGGTAYWTSWDFDALGQRQHQVEHSTTGGTDTTTSYTYNYNGNGTVQPHALASTQDSGASNATTSYAYDKAGNTTGRNTIASGNQTLAWNEAGQLTQVSGGKSGTTSYIYDADGNVLLQTDPSGTTLYLPGEQLTLTGSTTTGVRYLPLPGGGTVVRTGTTTNYKFEITDPHGTSSLYLDNTAQTPTWRQFTPYGGTRGATVSWIDNRGFLNAPNNTNTGLTQIGARQYDPTLGRFTSLDPVFAATDDQQLAGYAYSASNPVTYSDPTGLYCDGCSVNNPDSAWAPDKHNGPGCTTEGCYAKNSIGSYVAVTGPAASYRPSSKSGTHHSGGVGNHPSGLGGFLSGLVDEGIDMGMGLVNQGLDQLNATEECLLEGDLSGCSNFTPEGALINQGIPAIEGTWGTGFSIYTEYKQGDGAHASGRVSAFVVVALLTRGRGTEAEAEGEVGLSRSVRKESDPSFNSPMSAANHYLKHVFGVARNKKGNLSKIVHPTNPEFGGPTGFAEYKQAASDLLREPYRPGHPDDHLSSAGTLFRKDPGTGNFGILNSGGSISTFFRPGDLEGYFQEQVQLFP
ncbi:tRNA nuclease WapA [Streptomyces sp. MBT84]|nr:tRNA nuclease WapA [Streptomyces sp. MBT84]